MKSFKINPARYSLEKRLVKTFEKLPITSGKCLSIGCGNELRYFSLTKRYNVDGVDIIQPPKNTPSGFTYYQSDAANLPFKDSKYDLIIAIESFEHIEKNTQAMDEVYRTLKNNGYFIMTTPTNWTWIFEFGRHGPHYYSKKYLENLVKQSGMKVEKIFPCGGLLFWLVNILKSWLSLVFYPLLGKKWWQIMDFLLRPLYYLSKSTEKICRFPPSNWLLIAKK